MRVKAIIFDIGQTLVEYPVPLNWSALYRPAFKSIEKNYGLHISEGEYMHIGEVLAKYNTRINPREKEVSSDIIFSEIISGTEIPQELTDAIKEDFYGYFRSDVRIYPEAEDVLAKIKSEQIITGTLSDVAYGMDNEFALSDIKPLLQYIDFPYTSNDTGYRKPSEKGLEMLADKMNISLLEMVFVGDEKKDMECAKNAGVVAVLINRTDEKREYGQDFEIKNLRELSTIIVAGI